MVARLSKHTNAIAPPTALITLVKASETMVRHSKQDAFNNDVNNMISYHYCTATCHSISYKSYMTFTVISLIYVNAGSKVGTIMISFLAFINICKGELY